MDPEFEGLSESELRDLLEKADGYDERSKIRSALRSLKKASGKDRKPTGTSVYRRPGFQAPKNVQIPNSVTGNVLPQTLKDGDSVKPPDKNTPTIGYLNAGTTRTPKKAGRTSSTQSTGTQGGGGTGMKEQETWWRQSQSSSRSSRSQTPSDILEQKGHDETSSNDNPDQVFTESTHKEPTPEPPREPTPEPPREPTPESPREPTPEPPREPTPEPPREPTPEPPREPTPESPREPTPEPPREPTPEPERAPTPSPDPVDENVPSPEPDTPVESGYIEEQAQEYEEEENEGEEDEQFSDEEDEELKALADHHTSHQQGSNLELAVNKSLPIDVLQEVEPGLEENKDFRTKLRKAEDTKIDTKAAFPTQKKSADQVDFRNVLRKTTGPEKKSFQVEQVDFRNKLKPKDVDTPTHTPTRTPDKERDPSEDKIKVQQYEEEERELQQEDEQELQQEEEPEEDGNEENINEQVTPEVVTPEVKEVSPPDVKKDTLEEDSYEARKEARRREKEEREKQLKDVQEKVDNSLENGVFDEDSYEARREARRKAREARRLKESQETNKKPAMSYREQQRLDQAKRMEENKKKWGEMDQSNSSGNIEKPAVSRQRSTGAQKGAQQLLAWCQHKTKYYENVEVKDFSNSFANGLALCAILHTFVPDAIPYDDLSPDNPAENFGVALQVSEDIGIGSFFDVEDLLQVKSPDPKSMMTYLATIYQHFK